MKNLQLVLYRTLFAKERPKKQNGLNIIKILVDNFSHMGSAFSGKVDDGHNTQFPCEQKLEL